MLNPEEVLAAISAVVKILGPLESEDRQQVVQGVLLVLKEAPLTQMAHSNRAEEEVSNFKLSQKAGVWAKQNSVTGNELEHVFDINNGEVSVIAPEIIGARNSDKTINAYILSGIANFIATGEPTFSDKAARSLCETFGCYDSSNHSKYMKEKGNYFTGSKGEWKLTAPGLKFSATLVKQLSGASDAE